MNYGMIASGLFWAAVGIGGLLVKKEFEKAQEQQKKDDEEWEEHRRKVDEDFHNFNANFGNFGRRGQSDFDREFEAIRNRHNRMWNS